jgi:hypothetical protein
MVRRLILKHRYYFAFTAVGMDGKESDRSQVVSYVAQPLTNDIIPKLSTANHLPQAQPAPTKTQP